MTLQNDGSAKAYNYGVYIGNRYKNFTNIVWLHGNDFQTWTTATDNNLVKQSDGRYRQRRFQPFADDRTELQQ